MTYNDIEFQPLIRKLISKKELSEEEIRKSIDLISGTQVSHVSIASLFSCPYYEKRDCE